jgi:hypothetical protein
MRAIGAPLCDVKRFARGAKPHEFTMEQGRKQ